MSTNGTPAPWSLSDAVYGDAIYEVTAGSSPGVTVAWVCRKQDESEAEANARLVAAAPELLEAAHNAKETINSMYVQLGSPDNLKPLMEQLTDAVAKAKGGPR